MKVLVLEGDGIGPEITRATVDVLAAADKLFGLNIEYDRATIGFDALKAEGTTFPPRTLDLARACEGVVLGPVSHNEYPAIAEGGLNPSGELRKHLDLFANIRPAFTRDAVPYPSRVPFDLVIVRENTEGFYADRSMFAGPGEYMPTPDIALSTRKVTRAASERIAEEAFRLARLRRNKVTAVHKANVLRISDGLFLSVVREVAQRFPEVAYEEQLVDAMAALLVRDASQFDVIVATNMFGDILSDEASELAGSLGLGASLNLGKTYAVAQAQHGSAPSIAGKDLANPYALIASSSMMLDWLGARRDRSDLLSAAKQIRQALDSTIDDPKTRTKDLGGTLGTKAFTQAVIEKMQASSTLKA
ncbi:isocitrate/isopropylmalate dehydrogenase family protein [Bradyrhizobium canariense]|uniref:isocitrate/isopropylmalate dehydrogenase family protein n=1 Tax=Bradyrhizobium canariense TaxID=255045 RepID=UPI0018D2BD48|nr:isocitrate/isopropylmalate dehydrogenase family protein [Bradyrhizobium canariense]